MFADDVDANAGKGSVNVAAGSDTVTYAPPLRRIYVGGTGDVKVDTPHPTNTAGTAVTVTYKSVPANSYLSCRATKVYLTGTTATLMIGEY